MPRLIRRPSESCPPDPARYPLPERKNRRDDEKSSRSHRRQSSPALAHRRRESRRSTSVVSNVDRRSHFSTIDEDHKDDPESDYNPRDVYYLSHPHEPNDDKDDEKSQWNLDLEAGDATPMKRRDGYDEDARSTRSRDRIRRPSTIGTLSPRTRSPLDRSRRQSMRSDHGTDHHRRGSIRSRPRREPYQEVSDSETAISPRTRRRRRHINRSPTPPHRGSVIHAGYYPRPRPRSSTIPHHHHTNYTSDDEDIHHNNPRRYHRRAHSNPPSASRHHSYQSRRPSLNLATLKSSPKTASLLKAASRALEAGAAAALKLRKDSPSTPLFSAQSGSKIAAAALGAAVVDGLIEHEHRRHPKLMRKGGLRHHVVKQVVQRGVAGLVGGILEEGLTGGGGNGKGDGGDEGRGGKTRRKESVKRVAKGMVRDYERWEKGGGKGDEGKGSHGVKEENERENERKGDRGRRGSERGRDTDGEGRRERTRGSERGRDTDGEGRRERTRERERGREGSVRGRRR